MRKKIITIVIVMITIVNIIAASLIFFDVQLIQTPETTISIDIVEVNSKEAVIKTTIDIFNHNNFGLVTKNFEVVTTTPEGSEITRVRIEGGDIPPNENKTFTAFAYIKFNGSSPDLLTSRITGTLGVNIGFIQKTIPLAISIITSVEDVIKELAAPIIHIEADFGKITQENINILGEIDAYNPNTFDIFIENISMGIETETGKNVGALNVKGGTINAKSSRQFGYNGSILLEALNAKTLFFNMTVVAGVKLAGIKKSINISTGAQIHVPDLGTLLSIDSPTDLIIKSDYKVSKNGLAKKATLEIHNPHNITLEIKDLIVSTYNVYNGERQLICECKLEGGIVEPENVTYFIGEAIIPYHKLISLNGGKLFPDGLLLLVRGRITIQGINQSIWLGFGGYEDLHPLI